MPVELGISQHTVTIEDQCLTHDPLFPALPKISIKPFAMETTLECTAFSSFSGSYSFGLASRYVRKPSAKVIFSMVEILTFAQPDPMSRRKVDSDNPVPP